MEKIPKIKMARDLTNIENYSDEEILCIIKNEGILDYGSSEDEDPLHTENIVKILKRYIPTITKEQYENNDELQDLRHYNQVRILRRIITNLAYTIQRDRLNTKELLVDLEYNLKDGMNNFLKNIKEIVNYGKSNS